MPGPGGGESYGAFFLSLDRPGSTGECAAGAPWPRLMLWVNRPVFTGERFP